MLHEDFNGHKGEISEGGVQWMTAGKGIMHAEIPGSETVPAIGNQLWINLPVEHKFVDPKYQEFPKDQIRSVKESDNFPVKSLLVRLPKIFLSPFVYVDESSQIR